MTKKIYRDSHVKKYNKTYMDNKNIIARVGNFIVTKESGTGMDWI